MGKKKTLVSFEMSQLLEQAQQKWEGATFRNCGETAARCQVLRLQRVHPAAILEEMFVDELLWPLSKMPHESTSAKCKALHLHSQRRELDRWSEVNVTPQKWEMFLSHDEPGHQSTSLVKLLGSIRANVNWFSHRHTCSTVISVVTHLYNNGFKV